MAKRKNNPDVHSSRGKRRGKKPMHLGDYSLGKAVQSGTPFVTLDPDDYEVDTVFIVNPFDVKDGDNDVTVYWFGAVGTQYIAVLNMNEQDGEDEAADWLREHAPGYLISPEDMREDYDEALKGIDEDDDEARERAIERAEMDLDPIGGYGYYVKSWEHGVRPSDTDLEQRVINKATNIYRKEYGEDPPPSYGRRRRSNPIATDRAAILAARLARGL